MSRLTAQRAFANVATMPRFARISRGWFAQDRLCFTVAVAFLALVFLTGGSSRDDVGQLLLLRPLTILFGAFALTQLRWSNLRSLGAPFWLLLAMMALAIVQLIPLPPDIWESLPHRDIVREIEKAMQIEPGWRPLSLTPARTSNSLAAMTVPLVAMMFYGALNADRRKQLWPVLLVFAIGSALLGIIQVTGNPHGPAYLYRVTNPGIAVGFLANRNHQSVFLAIMILVAGWYFSTIRKKEDGAALRMVFAIGSIAILAPMVLLAYSRAGLGIAILSLIGAGWFIVGAQVLPKQVKLGPQLRIAGKWLVGSIFAGLGAILVITISYSRSTTFSRLSSEGGVEEMRLSLLPIIKQMLVDAFPFGSGLGSFEYVYQYYEPADLLRPQYVNLAHNDWLQPIVEAGLPALLIAMTFLLWLLWRAWLIWRSPKSNNRNRQLMAIGVIGLFLIASLVDYPLRTSAMAVVFTIACLTVAENDGRQFTGNGRANDIKAI